MGEMTPKTAKPKAPARPRKPRPVAFVRCGGGNKTCDGAPSCGQGCIGCGSCAEACKFGAISMNEHGVAFVNRELCCGCGVCVRKCPKGVIELVDPDRPIRVRCVNTSRPQTAKDKCHMSCIGCGRCARVCPMGAISLDHGHARIDYDECIACGMCAVTCPRGAISDAGGMFAAV